MDKLKSQLDVIKITGDDAETFIQGQITNDIKIISDAKKSIYSGYCSPKGRLLAIFFITKIKTNYFLFCPPCISKSISQRLMMFVLRSDVEITWSPKNIDYFLIDKKNIKKFYSDHIFLPTKNMETTLNPSESVAITLIDGFEPYFFILGDKKETSDVIGETIKVMDQDDFYSWNEIQVENNIPNIFNETQDIFIPQSLNLDLINAINFNKGCYTGQEVVARTHYLGKPKRRLYSGCAELLELPKLGSDILLGDEKVGSLVNFYKKKNNAFKILIELRIEKAGSHLTLDGKEIASIEMKK